MTTHLISSRRRRPTPGVAIPFILVWLCGVSFAFSSIMNRAQQERRRDGPAVGPSKNKRQKFGGSTTTTASHAIPIDGSSRDAWGDGRNNSPFNERRLVGGDNNIESPSEKSEAIPRSPLNERQQVEGEEPVAPGDRTEESRSPVNERPSQGAEGDESTEDVPVVPAEAGKLEELKQKEAELAKLLAAVRKEKLSAIRSRPLTIGVIGFGRFGQFIARTFSKYGRVVVTSRSDYTEIASGMGVKYVPLANPDAFLAEKLDVIVVAVSILSFKSTVKNLVPHIHKYLESNGGQQHGPLVVDVLSVKEHARNVLLELLPLECDILCSHPMFGPDSGKDGWQGLNFVYEKTRIDKVLLDPVASADHECGDDIHRQESFVDNTGAIHSVHEDSEAHVEGMDRMERFLSIWEEEGCRMVPMSCRDHDAYAANSQFITHLVGRVLGNQGLAETPIDTSGFQSVLKLVGTTTADSFDLFYGLYKYNQNSQDTIKHLQSAMEDVVVELKQWEEDEKLAQMQAELRST